MKKFSRYILLLILLALLFLIFERRESFLFKYSLKKCSDIVNQSEKIKCWDSLIEGGLESGDLDKSLDVVAFLFDTEPSFGPTCHDFVHAIGKRAYDLFEEGREFKVSSKTSYCAYGFYHGFMENMVGRSGDVAGAREFCNYVDSQLSLEKPGAKLACYHGIGHGWTNVHDERLWGDEMAMVNPALELCEKVTSDPHELTICATGVFDSISIGYYNEAYGLKINKNDPYWLCREQKEDYKKSCYMDISPAIFWLTDYELDESLTYLSVVEAKYVNLVAETLAENSVRQVVNAGSSPVGLIDTCRGLSGSRVESCIRGLSSGFLQFGEPGREEISAINFCNLDYLTETERGFCYARFLRDLKAGVSTQKYAKICDSLGDYGKYCFRE
jgi:hypothetical protein